MGHLEDELLEPSLVVVSNGGNDMPTIIGFSTSNSIISRIIRWFTRSKVSHSYIGYYSHTFDKYMVMESTWSGFRIGNYKSWTIRNKIVYEFKCKRDLSKSLKHISNDLDLEYDYWSALGLSVRRWFGKWYRNPFRDPNKLHCSEAVAIFLQHDNLAQSLDPESTTPEDLLQYCINSNHFEKL